MNVIIYGGGVISISKPSSSIVEDYTDYIQTYYITSSSTHNYRSRWAVGSSILHVHAQFYSSKVSHTVCMSLVVISLLLSWYLADSHIYR